MVVEVGCSLITIIRNYLVVLSTQLIRISLDLDNLEAGEKQLHTVHPLKSVLNMKLETLVSKILEAKRVENSGGNGLWLRVYFSCECKLSKTSEEKFMSWKQTKLQNSVLSEFLKLRDESIASCP